MIYTVTLNPAVDYVMNVSGLDANGINRSYSQSTYCGGKGINVSVMLTRLGVENTALGFAGGHNGALLRALLDAQGVRHELTELSAGETRLNVKIRYSGELDVNADGPAITAIDLDRLSAKLSALKKTDTVILSGSVSVSSTSDVYGTVASVLSSSGIRFAADTTGDDLLSTLKYRPFLIKPNHTELCSLFGDSYKDEAQLIRYARALKERGAFNVLVSLAENGALLIDENENIYRIGAVKGKLVNSSGCGDSMVAGFVSGYMAAHDTAHALILGAAAGNASAFCEGLCDKGSCYKLYEPLKKLLTKLS